ncbi:hypothetical protein ScPMuIL_002539 [Solemya velum]
MFLMYYLNEKERGHIHFRKMILQIPQRCQRIRQGSPPDDKSPNIGSFSRTIWNFPYAAAKTICHSLTTLSVVIDITSHLQCSPPRLGGFEQSDNHW